MEEKALVIIKKKKFVRVKTYWDEPLDEEKPIEENVVNNSLQQTQGLTNNDELYELCIDLDLLLEKQQALKESFKPDPEELLLVEQMIKTQINNLQQVIGSDLFEFSKQKKQNYFYPFLVNKIAQKKTQKKPKRNHLDWVGYFKQINNINQTIQICRDLKLHTQRRPRKYVLHQLTILYSLLPKLGDETKQFRTIIQKNFKQIKEVLNLKTTEDLFHLKGYHKLIIDLADSILHTIKQSPKYFLERGGEDVTNEFFR
ncbi:hypothetical protein M0813_26188 [Anaeramoeba flamelloides]|uniref:Uncharacterized protein n=1 Tax=Anaeramoeba flamelloides TaxID=1746091 RepID=A0ABQ8Y047_9EUKA|nr:hypothetical protein M0813_26188 [Anaeramoeba flamelloides]